MNIVSIQKIVRKAIKDYGITAKYDEEILVSFLSVDLFREMEESATQPPKATPRQNKVVIGQQMSLEP